MTDMLFRPWRVVDHTHSKHGGYIEIRGANDESICQMFPHAGRGGIGVENARRIAQAIVSYVGDGIVPATPARQGGEE
jgi:hypothetical protein